GRAPWGVRGTVGGRSWFQSGRSCTAISTSRAARALPVRERSSESNQAGKIVTMSILLPASRLVLGGSGHTAGPVGHHPPATRQVDLGDQRGDEGDERVATI